MKTLLTITLLFVCIAIGQEWHTQLKYDSTKFKTFVPKNRFYIDSVRVINNDAVATIDTLNNVKIPNGWQWILIIKDGQAWVFDSSMTKRNISYPNNYWH